MIDPRNMALNDWADSMTFVLEQYGSVPRLDGLEWQPWATAVLRLSVPNRDQAPDPYGFQDWREWGSRFQMFLGINS